MNSKKNHLQLIDEDHIDLYDLWLIIWGGKNIIVIIFIVSIAITTVYSMVTPSIYRAGVTLFPLSNAQTMMRGLFDNITVGGISISGKGDDSQKILAILNSRNIKEMIIRKMNLSNEILGEVPGDRDSIQAAVEIFGEKVISVSSDKKTGLITVYVYHTKPELARDIANTYIEVLQEILVTKTLFANKLKREFMENQLKIAEERITKAQKEMVQFQKRTKILDPKYQAVGSMGIYTELMAQKTSLEIRLKSLELALASESPIIKSMKAQLGAVEEKIKRFEGNKDLGLFPSMGTAPDKFSDYAVAYREVEMAKTIYTTVLKLYEQAKMEEVHEGVYVEIIDQAVTPDKRYSPKRKFVVGIGGIMSILFGIFLVLILEWIKNFKPIK